MSLKRKILMFQMLFIKLFGGGYKLAEFLKKKKYFKDQGEHCYFCPWNFGTEPELISFGENVHIASGVTFINHDIASFVFRYMDKENEYFDRRGEITIGDNVFIGTNSTILYDVNIGSNVIIGAGSLVNKDIPDGSVVAGVPARRIGDFEEYRKRYIKN